MNSSLDALLAAPQPHGGDIHAWLLAATRDASDVSLRTLHRLLPQLLALALDSNAAKDALAPPRDAPLLALLAPGRDQPLLRLLLRADAGLKYHVDAHARANESLAPLLAARRVAVADAGLPQPQPRLMLTMLEFFVYSLAHVAVAVVPTVDTRPRTKNQSSALGQSRPATPLSGYLNTAINQQQHQQNQLQQSPFNTAPNLPLPKLSTPLVRFSNIDDGYFALLQAYLDFFIPLESAIPSAVSRLDPSSADPPSGLRNRLHSSTTVGRLSSPSASAAVNILTCPELDKFDLNYRVSISEFIVALLVELWMNQHDYIETIRGGAKYTRPSILQIQCIQILVQHLSSLDVKSLFSSQLTQGSQRHQYHQQQLHLNEPVSLLSRCQTEIALISFESIQKPLYYLLRLYFKFGETDEFFPNAVDIWISYITPWRHQNSRPAQIGATRASTVPTLQVSTIVAQDWAPFITHNFLYYSRLLRNFMERAVTFDLFAATRPSDLTNSSSGPVAQSTAGRSFSSTQPSSSTTLTLNKSKLLHSSLDRVLSVYQNTNGLLNVLKHLDAILVGCELPSSSDAHGSLLLTPTRPTSPMRSRGRTNSGGNVIGTGSASSGVDWIEKLGGLEVVSSWVKNRVVSAEGKIDYSSMFMASAVAEAMAKSGNVGADAPGLVLARTMLGNIYSTINRLNTYLPVNLPLHKPLKSPLSPTSPSSPTSTTVPAVSGQFPTLPTQWDGASLNLYFWNLLFWIGRTIWSHIVSSEGLDKERQLKRTALLQSAVAKLYGLSKVCVDVFGVSETERSEIEAGVIGGSEEYANGGVWSHIIEEEEAEENVYSSELLPGVVTPDIFKNDALRVTAAGRMQIKLGLRKSDPKNVPVRSNERVKKLVMSYEFEWVVGLTDWVAVQFDYYYPLLREKAPLLPKNAGLHWLRFFAAKQNILFTIVTAFAGYISFKLFWWILFTEESSSVGASSGGAGSASHVAPRKYYAKPREGAYQRHS